MESNKQFNGWPTERIVEKLDETIASDVPHEYQEQLRPLLSELKVRVGFFNGTVDAQQIASGRTGASA